MHTSEKLGYKPKVVTTTMWQEGQILSRAIALCNICAQYCFLSCGNGDWGCVINPKGD